MHSSNAKDGNRSGTDLKAPPVENLTLITLSTDYNDKFRTAASESMTVETRGGGSTSSLPMRDEKALLGQVGISSNHPFLGLFTQED